MTKEVKKVSVLKRIMTALALGEEGRLGKFFRLVVKEEKTKIKQLEANLKGMALQQEIAVEELESQIEDAVEAVEIAYESVTPEDVSTNADMKEFKDTYWYLIDIAQSSLEGLQNRLEKKVESYTEEVEYIEKQIVKHNTRIKNIG